MLERRGATLTVRGVATIRTSKVRTPLINATVAVVVDTCELFGELSVTVVRNTGSFEASRVRTL